MNRNPFADDDPKPADRNPFGADDLSARARNPFGDEPPTTQSPAEAAERIENAARRIRGLRTKLGAEGLTYAATRELIDEVASGLEAAAKALRDLSS